MHKRAQNLSKNNLGHDGAVAVGDLLENDNELLYLDLSGELYNYNARAHVRYVDAAVSKCINFDLINQSINQSINNTFV